MKMKLNFQKNRWRREEGGEDRVIAKITPLNHTPESL